MIFWGVRFALEGVEVVWGIVFLFHRSIVGLPAVEKKRTRVFLFFFFSVNFSFVFLIVCFSSFSVGGWAGYRLFLFVVLLSLSSF